MKLDRKGIGSATILIVLAAVAFGTVGPPVLADAVDSQADSPLYPLEKMGEKIKGATYAGGQDWQISLAEERANEFSLMVDKKKGRIHANLLEEADSHLLRAITLSEDNDELREVSEAIASQLVTLENAKEKVPKKIRSKIVKLQLKNFGRLRVIDNTILQHEKLSGSLRIHLKERIENIDTAIGDLSEVPDFRLRIENRTHTKPDDVKIVIENLAAAVDIENIYVKNVENRKYGFGQPENVEVAVAFQENKWVSTDLYYYSVGENVAIYLKNKADEEIEFGSWWIEGYRDNEWRTVYSTIRLMVIMPMEPGEVETVSWDQSKTDRLGKVIDEQVEPGKYRVVWNPESLKAGKSVGKFTSEFRIEKSKLWENLENLLPWLRENRLKLFKPKPKPGDPIIVYLDGKAKSEELIILNQYMELRSYREDINEAERSFAKWAGTILGSLVGIPPPLSPWVSEMFAKRAFPAKGVVSGVLEENFERITTLPMVKKAIGLRKPFTLPMVKKAIGLRKPFSVVLSASTSECRTLSPQTRNRH